MRLSPMIVVVSIALAVTSAGAHQTKHGNITIVHPWVSATHAANADAIVSIKINFAGKQTEQLLSATSPRSARIDLVNARGMVIDHIDLKADGQVVLGAKGPQLILRSVPKPLSVYENFPMTLTFAKAGKLEVDVTVEEDQ